MCQDVYGKLILTELVLLHLLYWLMNLICISPGRFLRHFLISAVNLGKFLYVVLPDVILKVAETLSSASDLHTYCIWEPTMSYYHTIKYRFPSFTPVKLLVTPKKQKVSSMKHNSWLIYFLGSSINRFERRGNNISRVFWGVLVYRNLWFFKYIQVKRNHWMFQWVYSASFAFFIL